jgi:hypothetical protein
MFSRSLIICSCLILAAGCTYEQEPAPKIIHTPTRAEPAVIKPRVVKPTLRTKSVSQDVPSDWVPPAELERKWTAIVIHHSGTSTGNVAIFDRWHREGNHWEGVGYDFVIGNGTDSADGEVEVTFRWRQQRTGAHCRTPSNWANENAVGICLVGNFSHTVPTGRQMQSLVELVRFLQRRYGIAKSHIYGHKDTPGAHVTYCPGRKFPMAQLKSMLDF